MSAGRHTSAGRPAGGNGPPGVRPLFEVAPPVPDPGSVTRAQRVALVGVAVRAGREWAASRQRRANPYDGLSANPVERRLSVAWAHGYSTGHPFGPGQPFDPFRTI